MRKTPHSILLISVTMATIIFLAVNGAVRTEYEQKPHIQEEFAEQDYQALYDFYIAATPNLAGRPYYGDPDAPITLILYTDFTSAGAQAFADDILPGLLSEFVHTGKAKLYHKHHLTTDDYQQKTPTYYYAQSLSCYHEQQPATYYEFLFALFNTTLHDLPELVGSHGADRQALMQCIREQTFKNIKEDLGEVQQFGMVGITPRLYVGMRQRGYQSIDGVPVYDQVRRKIRDYQVRLGD
ncbi:thioredoxin domain-containing protein [Candidatus Woesearchaeota archaeon]|nr:thioredoxin domain-containing protein [Candidatus Woesearchaeota archaeon]